MKAKSKLHKLAQELGCSLNWLYSHRARYTPPEWAFESSEKFNLWRAEWEQAKKSRFLESMSKLRKSPEHKKAKNEATRRAYLARPEVQDRIRQRDKLRGKEYRQRPEVRARHAARMRARKDQNRARYHADPQFRIAVCLRNRTRKVLNGKIKSGSTMQMVGCTGAELKVWLEKQFAPGMTWENYGHGWHIDHKRPLASFDLMQESQQREAFHFTNLQPLWAVENKSKGDKWQKN